MLSSVANFPTVVSAVRETCLLLEDDPDLGRSLSSGELGIARREARCAVSRLHPGSWDPGDREPAEPHLGFLVLDGLIAREVSVGARSSLELLGAGDVLRPWRYLERSLLIETRVTWSVLEPARLGVLDAGVLKRLSGWPQIVVELLEREIGRSQGLAVEATLRSRLGIEPRLLAFFAHLAERWGRVGPDGISVPVALTHTQVAHLLGASRPTVTTGLGSLASAGLLRRNAREWLISDAGLRKIEELAGA